MALDSSPPARYVGEVASASYGPADRVVALTFDDGPDPAFTRQILAVLDRYDVPATFFAVGTNAARYPDLTREIAAAGHSVQSHTWSHVDLTRLPAVGWDGEIARTSSLLASLSGQAVSCLRPPYGSLNPSAVAQIQSRNLQPVLWSNDSEDWKRPGVSSIVRNALDGLRPGSVFLFHDGGGDRSQTVAALPAIISAVRSQGYGFASLCGGSPPSYASQIFGFGGPSVAPNSIISSAPFVGASTSRNSSAHWLVTSNGAVFGFNGGRYFGSAAVLPLNRPIVGMASTPDGDGYWLVASDGGVFSFGNARFHGSTGNIMLNRPIVGIAGTPDGGGYWLVASDGGVFSFGNAGFHGSTGAMVLNRPIVGIASTPDGGGYWLVASDGGVFSFGNAGFHGSTGNIILNRPIVGMASTADGRGYHLVASDGGVFNFGSAPFYGAVATTDRRMSFVAVLPDASGYLLVGQRRE